MRQQKRNQQTKKLHRPSNTASHSRSNQIFVEEMRNSPPLILGHICRSYYGNKPLAINKTKVADSISFIIPPMRPSNFTEKVQVLIYPRHRNKIRRWLGIALNPSTQCNYATTSADSDTKHIVTTNKHIRGRLFTDRDYHVHLGGAIPPCLISQWIEEGHLALENEIPDLVAASANVSLRKDTHFKADAGKNVRELPMISVRDALIQYREVNYSMTRQQKGEKTFLSAYNDPPYPNLPVFLTLYRAYSKRFLLHQNAKTIAGMSANQGGLIHPKAEVRVSLPPPNERHSFERAEKESYLAYASRALEEMIHFQASLLPSQKLVITFPRQTFNVDNNREYLFAFLELLRSSIDSKSHSEYIDPTTPSFSSSPGFPWSKSNPPAFDFAGQPLPLAETLPLLERLRSLFSSSEIFYHHGEVCPHIEFSKRVKDTFELLPYVNRIGHGLCLGLAILGMNPEIGNRQCDQIPPQLKASIEENRQSAYDCLKTIARSNIGIEVSPTCNITLGGAQSKEILRKYVQKFLNIGVDVFVGSDDPAFLNTTLETEIQLLHGLYDTRDDKKH